VNDAGYHLGNEDTATALLFRTKDRFLSVEFDSIETNVVVQYDLVAFSVEKRAKGEKLGTPKIPIPKNSSVLLETLRFALLSTEEANQYQIVSFFDPDSPRFLALKLESEPVFIYAPGREKNEFFIVCRGDEVVEVADEPCLSPLISGDRVLSVFGGRRSL
jgi:hypothetical protein